MKQQQQEKKETAEGTKVTEVERTDETTKTFEGGFFQVNSPVKPGTVNFCLLIICLIKVSNFYAHQCGV